MQARATARGVQGHEAPTRTGEGAAPATAGIEEPRQAAGFVGEGNVVAVVPDTQQVVIDHGDIPGYMHAMTMGFRVVSPALLTGLKAGDRVRFTIGAQEKAIIQIEKMGK